MCPHKIKAIYVWFIFKDYLKILHLNQIELIVSGVFFSAGGLVTAVAPVVIQCSGIWVGWTGLSDYKSDDRIPESSPDDCSPTSGLRSIKVISMAKNCHSRLKSFIAWK